MKLDNEIVDRIVVNALKDQRKYLRKELKRYGKNPLSGSNPNGVWMHPDDVAKSHEYIHALDLLINYYGG